MHKTRKIFFLTNSKVFNRLHSSDEFLTFVKNYKSEQQRYSVHIEGYLNFALLQREVNVKYDKKIRVRN